MTEGTDVEEGQYAMPFYIICDVSVSMSGDMAALNDGLQRLRRAIISQPVVDEVAHISVMTFSDSAQIVSPMGQMSETSLPSLSKQGGTNYGSAFRLLADSIMQDSKALRRQGYKVYRSCAFFLTDGEPQDGDWLDTFNKTLTFNPATESGMLAYPIFAPFGFRDARDDVLSKLAFPPNRGKWYSVKTGSIEDALSGILDVIMKTVVTGALTASKGAIPRVDLQKPTNPAVVKMNDRDPDDLTDIFGE